MFLTVPGFFRSQTRSNGLIGAAGLYYRKPFGEWDWSLFLFKDFPLSFADPVPVLQLPFRFPEAGSALFQIRRDLRVLRFCPLCKTFTAKPPHNKGAYFLSDILSAVYCSLFPSRLFFILSLPCLCRGNNIFFLSPNLHPFTVSHQVYTTTFLSLGHLWIV